MELKQTVLIVDNDRKSQDMLRDILAGDYDLLTAGNGLEALEHLQKNGGTICAVLTAQDMESMDVYSFLTELTAAQNGLSFPVLVTARKYDREREAKALASGAWDYLAQPYDARIVRARLKNAVERSRVFAFRQLVYLEEYDALTGIYNKQKFTWATQQMITASPELDFDLIRLDIDRFSLVNAFYGIQEGDRLLRFVAAELGAQASRYSPITYGHMEADVFALCIPRQTGRQVAGMVDRWCRRMKEFRPDFDTQSSFGIYRIEDRTLPVAKMLDFANLAAKQVKDSYIRKYAFYTEEMSRRLEAEQEIVNEMAGALEQEQFVVYIQPKYDLATRVPVGGEALVRWLHPERGMVPPGAFIPIFERNGFVSKLDHYLWEKVCQLLHAWAQEGRDLYPISVNMSPVDLYNANLVEILCALTKKYEISNQLLQLELTESAYTSNPDMIRQSIHRLHEAGFSVLMDDFGRGYSSLNALKDIEIDALKIDMGFFTKSDIQGRGENIVASVVRMAKWLNISTIAEGVEESEQVEFLNSIGCEYVQGYYFAKPMPIPDFGRLMSRRRPFVPEKKLKFNADALWATNPQMELLFSKMTQPMGVYELDGDHIEALRMNQAFLDQFGFESPAQQKEPILAVRQEDRESVLEAFRAAAREEGARECEYVRLCRNNTHRWIHMGLRYVDRVEDKCVILATMQDVTQEKELDAELSKYRQAISHSGGPNNQMLIVDDLGVNRIILANLFKDSYQILEAANGKEAIQVLQENQGGVDVILLDLMMPEMDGREFLEYKKNQPELADIPVVVITADSSHNQQVNILALGADDYIVKPFVKEVVRRRVRNVLESHRRFREVLREYNTILEKAQTDPLTKLQNRSSAIDLIMEILRKDSDRLHALIMLDVDGFKSVNDTFGHIYGDQVLIGVASHLRRFFRNSDIVSRFGGDEFCVFMRDVPSADMVLRKCMQLCAEITHSGFRGNVSISAGIAVTDPSASDFETLYRNADAALYDSKHGGRNTATLFHACEKQEDGA